MEASRLVRKRAYSRQQSLRLIGLTGKTALVCLLLLGWFLDRQLVFTIVLINIALAMLFANYYNVRSFLPGVSSANPLTRIAALLFYILLILGIVGVSFAA